MAKDIFNRYIWLVDTIYKAKQITFEEINERWVRNTMNNGDDIPLRTFHNHRKAIEDIFDIIIECDRKNGYKYYIENVKDIEQGGLRSWLLNTFAINNLINESHKLKNRFQFEQIPSGQEYLTAIIEAMRDNIALEITYQSYWRDTPTTFPIEPYFVKVFKQRWYVIAYSQGPQKIMIYALDRIRKLSLIDRYFELPKEFDSEEYFYNYFGIINDENSPPCKVKISANTYQAEYLKSLPLHHSQKEIEINEKFSVFQYYIHPTFDFRKELLSMGAEIEILEPIWFREEIREVINEMNIRYRQTV
ncbi:WYL domain-containing protein [Dysgonomonas alginatilytica]|uniref:WYL domain-containing protein n=1 Tax=Dysgonomonas alginatilytica TaxID=1605892 RepID=A0A2V3PU20_9BACT|nr:WYL domain-containing protein [Dysgonomonas alginatilytica]PXV62800.1 WYL domain-containing protein [Dysgonomonas alginatilytica]